MWFVCRFQASLNFYRYQLLLNKSVFENNISQRKSPQGYKWYKVNMFTWFTVSDDWKVDYRYGRLDYFQEYGLSLFSIGQSLYLLYGRTKGATQTKVESLKKLMPIVQLVSTLLKTLSWAVKSWMHYPYERNTGRGIWSVFDFFPDMLGSVGPCGDGNENPRS